MRVLIIGGAGFIGLTFPPQVWSIRHPKATRRMHYPSIQS